MGSGRPLGFLLAWLESASHSGCGSRGEHMSSRKILLGIRRVARERLAHIGLGHGQDAAAATRLLAAERMLRADEEPEPRKMA